MIVYNCRHTATGYMFTKFDPDFNVESVSTVSEDGSTCDCPGGQRPSCRHRKMLPIFAANGAIDSELFYEYERQLWHTPVETQGEGDATAEKAVAALNIPPDALTPEAEAKVSIEVEKPKADTGFRRRV